MAYRIDPEFQDKMMESVRRAIFAAIGEYSYVLDPNDELLGYCESPIEELLGYPLSGQLMRFALRGWSVRVVTAQKGLPEPFPKLAAYPQAPVLGDSGREYRADYAILVNGGTPSERLIVVECDGHEFHERTKAQASRDRSRDRDLQAAGHLVCRFTGSEIWKDAFECSEHIRREIERLSRETD